MKHCALTTIDNPYNPFTQFDDWFAYDTQNGYNSCGILDRIMNTTENMSMIEINLEKERAIDEIILHDFLNVFKKVVNENEDEIDDEDISIQ